MLIPLIASTETEAGAFKSEIKLLYALIVVPPANKIPFTMVAETLGLPVFDSA